MATKKQPTNTLREVASPVRQLSSSELEVGVSRNEYAMMKHASKSKGAIRQSPQNPERREDFMNKLFMMSRIHVDEAVDAEVRRKEVPEIAYSVDSSTMGESEDSSTASTSTPVIQKPQLESVTQQVEEKSKGKLPVVQYLIDLVERTANFDCMGSCTALQASCDNIGDFVERTPIASLDAAHLNLSYCSTDEEETFGESLYSTFDDTIADTEDTTLLVPLQEPTKDKLYRNDFDDVTTYSSQNSLWV